MTMWRCTACDHQFSIPAGECPRCGRRKEIVKVQEGLIARSPARLASEISVEKKEKVPSGFPLADLLLTGGLTRGFSILLSGAPGTGKSTMLAQLVAGYTDLHKVMGLYGTAEEEDSDVASRMRRLELPLDRTIVIADSVGEQYFAEWKRSEAKIGILDSVQAFTFKGYPLRSVQGSAELVLNAHRFAHETQSIAIIVCHETKDGDAAGPLALIHYVDCAIRLDMTPDFRRYAVVMKNRRGIAPMQQMVEMTARGLIPFKGEEDASS